MEAIASASSWTWGWWWPVGKWKIVLK